MAECSTLVVSLSLFIIVLLFPLIYYATPTTTPISGLYDAVNEFIAEYESGSQNARDFNPNNDRRMVLLLRIVADKEYLSAGPPSLTLCFYF